MAESIGVDVDDVLADHAEAFVEFSNRRHGTNLTVDDYNEHWPSLWGVNKGQAEEIAKEFHTPEITAKYLRKQGAAEALGALSAKYSMVIVTARPEHLVDTTVQWIEGHFPNTFSDIRFVPIWMPGNTITKADICREVGLNYLIDDVPKHCNIAAEVGINSLLFGDYSWNRLEQLHPGVKRVHNWQQVMEYFNEQS